MGTSERARLALLLVSAAAVVLASVAVFLTLTFGDPLSLLFREVLTIQVIAVLVLWFGLAWAARRYTVGKLPKASINSRTALVWGGSRVAFLIATVLVMVGWLGSLALGLELATALVRALALLCVTTAFTGIAGGALLNSALAVCHWRRV